jgi:hypothetical protein
MDDDLLSTPKKFPVLKRQPGSWNLDVFLDLMFAFEVWRTALSTQPKKCAR